MNANSAPWVAGLAGEFTKCLTEGKSVIIEGFHARPAVAAMALRGLALGSAEEGGLREVTPLEAAIVPFLLVVEDEEVHWQLYQEWRRHQVPAAAEVRVRRRRR